MSLLKSIMSRMGNNKKKLVETKHTSLQTRSQSMFDVRRFSTPTKVVDIRRHTFTDVLDKVLIEYDTQLLHDNLKTFLVKYSVDFVLCIINKYSTETPNLLLAGSRLFQDTKQYDNLSILMFAEHENLVYNKPCF